MNSIRDLPDDARPATLAAEPRAAMPWYAGQDGDAPALTTLAELRRHVALLGLVEETEAPFVSCYLGFERRGAAARDELEARTRSLRGSLGRDARVDFDAAMDAIGAYLATRLRPDARGAALFSRSVLGGAFFLPMQFAVALPDWIGAGPAPQLFHLMALMDTYERYVVAIATRASYRIVEVDLGVPNAKGWSRRPQSRNRGHRSWANPLRESGHRHAVAGFVGEQADLLARVMAAGAHAHLVLAGEPRYTSELRRALPPWVANKLVATIPAAAHHDANDVLDAAMSAFVDWEERESHAVAMRALEAGRETPATGASACLDVLRRRRAGALVFARDHAPTPAWRCAACGTMRLETEAPDACPDCGGAVWRTDTTVELVRLAARSGSAIEIVDHCAPLLAAGGVACVLQA